jgi:hypothetical protein
MPLILLMFSATPAMAHDGLHLHLHPHGISYGWIIAALALFTGARLAVARVRGRR